MDEVRSNLIKTAEAEHRRVLKAIERDTLTARLIEAGLKERPSSEAYKVARAFLDDCNRACGQAEREADAEILQYLKADDLKIDDDEGGQTDDGTADSAEPSEKDD